MQQRMIVQVTEFVQIDSRKLRSSLKRLETDLKRPASMYGQASRHMRDYVRGTIKAQGRKRSYAPLSRWTKGRTGRRKALITLVNRFKAKWDNRRGEVYFDPVSTAWNITQHHQGFTSPAVDGKRMVVPKAGGGRLAVFTRRKASKVPAREIWPTAAELIREVQPIVAKWVEKSARKNWR